MSRQHNTALDIAFRHLHRGGTYRVCRAFRDYDGILHPVGEVWAFMGSHFVPYHDGLSLFATIDAHEQQVRLQWTREEQGPVIDALDEYLEPCTQAAQPPVGS